MTHACAACRATGAESRVPPACCLHRPGQATWREKGTGTICAEQGTDRRLVAGRSGKLDQSPFPFKSGNHRRQASATEPREGNTGDAVTMSIQTRERGTGTICAEHPTGRSGKLNQSPFPFGLPEELGGLQAMVRKGRDRLLPAGLFPAASPGAVPRAPAEVFLPLPTRTENGPIPWGKSPDNGPFWIPAHGASSADTCSIH